MFPGLVSAVILTLWLSFDRQMDVPVRIIGGETVLVTFTGVGYDERVMGDTLPVKDVGSTAVPDKQIVQVPKQVSVN